jgi:hypothetical protein
LQIAGNARIQLVELHLSNLPVCDYAAVKSRAQAILGEELDASDPDEAKDAFLMFYKNHLSEFSDRKFPAQTAILDALRPIDIDSGRISNLLGYRR